MSLRKVFLGNGNELVLVFPTAEKKTLWPPHCQSYDKGSIRWITDKLLHVTRANAMGGQSCRKRCRDAGLDLSPDETGESIFTFIRVSFLMTHGRNYYGLSKTINTVKRLRDEFGFDIGQDALIKFEKIESYCKANPEVLGPNRYRNASDKGEV